MLEIISLATAIMQDSSSGMTRYVLEFGGLRYAQHCRIRFIQILRSVGQVLVIVVIGVRISTILINIDNDTQDSAG